MKSFLFFVLGIVLCTPALACDICGCFMGITPFDNQSSIAFLHRYRVFNGYKLYEQPSHFFPTGAYKVTHGDMPGVPKTYSTKDYESYKVYELRFKYFLHPRIEVNAIVPLNANKSLENGIKTENVGLGDPTFFAGYHLIRRIDVEGMQQRLIAGAGIKIPVGNYHATDDDGDERLPLMMQTGTGSLDYFVYLNYIIGYKRFGISTNVMHKFNGENHYNEYIDNSTSAYMNVFYKFRFKEKLTVIPSVQAYYEYTNGIYIQGSLQEGTKMNGLLVGPGLDLFYKNIGINMAFQWRGYEETTPDNLKSSGRMVIGLSYNFNQSKYLLKKKN